MNMVILLGGAGMAAGTMNALAGGGSFVSLPALIAAGLPSVTANASSTVALWPGGLASLWIYRDGLGPVGPLSIRATLAATVAGGFAGSLLLLGTPARSFDHILPWLLLAATIMLAMGPQLGPRLRRHVRIGPGTMLALQFMLGVYGGYFGGAVGLMMLAAWHLIDGTGIKALNAPRTLMVGAANSVAMLCFAIAGAVRWRETAILGLGALAGGYAGARLGRILDPALVRTLTLLCAAAITAIFFYRSFS